MAERLNLLAWAMLILGFLLKYPWLIFLGLVFLLLFAIIQRVYFPFPHLIPRLLGALSFLGMSAALGYYLFNPTQENLYLGIALWLLVALFDLLADVYYGK